MTETELLQLLFRLLMTWTTDGQPGGPFLKLDVDPVTTQAVVLDQGAAFIVTTPAGSYAVLAVPVAD